MTEAELNFIKDYFIQTRKEIDTEKHERDQILHFIMLLYGILAIGFKIGEDGVFQLKLLFWLILFLPVPILSLFYVRAKKLTQIYDRWIVLWNIIQKSEIPIEAGKSMEYVVWEEIKENKWRDRYIEKDIFLSVAFLLPLFALQGYMGYKLYKPYYFLLLLILWIVIAILNFKLIKKVKMDFLKCHKIWKQE